MESSEKTEWPSAQVLAELREQGKVAISQSANYCAGTLGLLAGCLFIYNDLIKVVSDMSFALHSSEQAYPKIITLCLNNSHLIIVPALGFLLSYWLIGLVQTKFFFKMGLLSLSLAKLWRFSLKNKSSHLFLVAPYIISLVFVFMGVGLFLWSVVPALLAILNSTNAYLNLLLLDIIQKLALTVVLTLVAILIMGVVFKQLLFRFQNRVSKQTNLNGRDS